MKQHNIEVSRRNILGRISSATLGAVNGRIEPLGLFTPSIQLS